MSSCRAISNPCSTIIRVSWRPAWPAPCGIFKPHAVAEDVAERGDVIVTLLPEAVAHWRKATEPVVETWLKDMKEHKVDGGKMIASAHALLAKYASLPEPQPPQVPLPEQEVVTQPQQPRSAGVTTVPNGPAPAAPVAQPAPSAPPSAPVANPVPPAPPHIATRAPAPAPTAPVATPAPTVSVAPVAKPVPLPAPAPPPPPAPKALNIPL